MTNAFVYYCIAYGSKRILTNRNGIPFLFNRKKDADSFLSSEEGRELLDFYKIEQSDLSVKKAVVSGYGW